MYPILLRNKMWALCSGFLEVKGFRVGLSDVHATKLARKCPPKTTTPGRHSRLPGLVLIDRRIRGYPTVALRLSSSESVSLVRASETMS